VGEDSGSFRRTGLIGFPPPPPHRIGFRFPSRPNLPANVKECWRPTECKEREKHGAITEDFVRATENSPSGPLPAEKTAEDTADKTILRQPPVRGLKSRRSCASTPRQRLGLGQS
jgi:hypothetical protein